MTQAVTTAEPAGQPFGFASPKAPPLSQAPVASGIQQSPAAPPDAYTPPAEPVAPLEAIAPAPPEYRDPQAPFIDNLPAPEAEVSWTPNQPLPLSAASTGLDEPSVDLGALPPPHAEVPPNLPPPTGMPVNALPPSPYGANPYATGPYSTPGPYPGAPGGYPPPGGQPGQWSGQQPAGSLLQRLDLFVVGLMVLGAIWAEVAAYTLLAAAIAGVVRRVPGRILLAVCGGIGLSTSVLWYLGYIGTGQWHAMSQLLCLVSLLGVVIFARQATRRP